MQAAKENSRSANIAAIRGLAILSVIQCHYMALPGWYRALGAPDWLDQIFKAGGGGVDLFFVISGFLLTRGLLNAKNKDGVIAAFYRRRIRRIIPAYWLLLAIGFASSPVFMRPESPASEWLWGNAYSPLVYLSFAQNIFIGIGSVWGAHFFAHTWSLALEEQFYLAIPLLVVMTSRRGLTAVALGALVLAPVLRIVVALSFSKVACYVWPIARIDAFAWGIAIAILGQARPDLLRHIPAAALAIGSMTLFAGYAAIVGPQIGDDPAGFALSIGITDALAAMLVLAAVAAPSGAAMERSFAHRTLAWAGERCYSLYLFHNACHGIAVMTAETAWFRESGLPPFASLLAAWVATFVIGNLSYRFVERPFMTHGQAPLVRNWRASPTPL